MTVFSSRLSPNIIKYRNHQWDLSTNRKARPFQTHWRVQLVCMNVQAQSFLESQLEYNRGQTPWWIKVCYDLFNHLGSYKNIMHFQISARKEKGLRDTWRINIIVIKKFLAQHFVLWDAEDNTSVLLNRVGIANSPLLRTLLTLLRDSSLWEVIDYFVLLAYSSLEASRIFLQ